MPMRSGIVSIDRLRQVVNVRLATMSLRALAREVGMSPSGLQKFADGSVPYLPTREKLERWYVREAAASRVHREMETVLAALKVLVGELPTRRRERVAAEVLGVLDSAYDGRVVPRPSWLDEARDALREKRE